MKTRLLFSIFCALTALQAVADVIIPELRPKYPIMSDRPFIRPLVDMIVQFDRPMKRMDNVIDPVVVKCDGAVVAEASELEISNHELSSGSFGWLVVYFEKQNLPKGKTYELCIPEGIVGSAVIEDGCQLVNAALTQEFSVPVSLGPWHGPEEGMKIPDSRSGITFYWGFETKAVGEPKFDLYREGEKIAELSAAVFYDWDLGQVSPVYDEYMVFDNDVNYTLIFPAGSVSTLYRDDITNDEVVFNFVGGQPARPETFTCTSCSLSSDISDVIGEVSFTFDRPIEVAVNATIQLYSSGRRQQLIMEVTPWVNYDANCWLLECDFGGYPLEENKEYIIVIPARAVVSAEDSNVECERSEFRIKYSGIEDITADESKSQPFYNLQGIKEDNPVPGRVYIHNGRKVIIR